MGADGLVLVDKPAGWTSHDVVARLRRLAGTRRVGHAGTLDPMATGVLVIGVGRATRLLGHLAAHDKTYGATIRLGESTVTDDAEGERTHSVSTAGVAEADVLAGVRALTGSLDQVPSAVSAVKVDGRRAYARVRAGEQVELAPRRVAVSAFEVLGTCRRPGDAGEVLDVDVTVTCSSGTYVRALARDLGAGLGVGGHLTRLRRTRVGGYGLDRARTLDELESSFEVLPLADAVAAAFPHVDVDAVEVARVRHGGPLPGRGTTGPVGVFGPDGSLLALAEEREGVLRYLAVFASD